MIRKLMTVFALLLTVGLAAAPAVAQDFDLETIEDSGLTGIHGRLYVAGSALTGGPGLMGVMVVGFDFDTPETAGDIFEFVTCAFIGGMLDVEDEGDCEALVAAGADVADVNGIGSQAIEVSAEQTSDDEVTPMLVLSTQSENRIFMLVYLGDNTPGIADDFGQFLAEAEPQDSDVVFDVDGNASGGFFDMLPQAGDEIVEGLIPFEDMDIYSEMLEGES